MKLGCKKYALGDGIIDVVEEHPNPQPILVDAPAPTNIAITPNAVGGNPITYYYKVCLLLEDGGSRTQFSDEILVEQGDDTTQLTLNLTSSIEYDFVFIVRGLESGVYTHETSPTITSVPAVITEWQENIGIYENELNNVIIYQIESGITDGRISSGSEFVEYSGNLYYCPSSGNAEGEANWKQISFME